MTQTNIRPINKLSRSNWIRLRTMILLRWVAIVGQIIAVTVAPLVNGLQLELGLCFLAIGASISFNLAATFLYPENKRLTEKENFAMVMFDLLQLMFLLYLTGGLNNPFALLVLVPVIISATALSLRSTILLCTVAIILVTLLAFMHLPLVTRSGEVLRIPELFLFGHWVALIIAIGFSSAYSRRVSTEVHTMSDALAATQMALAREQKLTDLGGVVAAAAHELGTPLATIKLASTELRADLQDFPEMAEDAALISEQADRCRDILRSMGRAGKDDLHMRKALLETVIEEAAEPHRGRGKSVLIVQNSSNLVVRHQPEIWRQPEIVHGLRNLIQNAVDFANSNVWIETTWSKEVISIRITDDGPGFPPHLLGRIGDPFVRRSNRMSGASKRPEYEGMGLGLFIAKTLLERSGATIRFANDSNPNGPALKRGAVVDVIWPRQEIDAKPDNTPSALGQNQPVVA